MLSILQLTPYGAGNPLHLLWAIPVGLVTLPLLPIGTYGDKIIRECELDDFKKATSHLRCVSLPNEYSYIDNDRGDQPNAWYCIVNHYDDFHEFSSMEECRNWFLLNGFEEVVALDYPASLTTYWIKNDEL